MKTFITFMQKHYLRWLDQLDHDQRKQFATTCNTIAAIICVQVVFGVLGKEDLTFGKIFLAISAIIVSIKLWQTAINVVRNNKE